MSGPPQTEADVPAVWEVGEVVLGLYEVVGVAGEGGMGVVYRVRHCEWDVDLAVKSPRPSYLRHESDRAAFVREAQTWIELGLHPHVCACHYVRVLGGIPRLFAEYVEQGSLEDWVRDRRMYAEGHAVALERMLSLALQFARGLLYAHSRSLVHQDVKPANVLLDADGVAKVSDFGIARASGAAHSSIARPDNASVADPRVSFGGMTPAYRSPEQARAGAALTGEQAPMLSAATDVWSLAVSVLELFMGDVPGADGQAAGEVLAEFVVRGAQDPVIPEPPEALMSLLGRCLRFEPAERPSMGEVAGELEEIYARQTGSSAPAMQSQDVRLLAGELSNRALSLLDLGRPAEAERLWEEALDQDPHHPEATYNQGLHLWRNATITDDELVRRMEAVRASHEQDWRDEYLLALVHLERGDAVAADALLATAEAQGGRGLELTKARRLAGATVKSARALPTLEGHTGGVESVALTPDGRLALTGGADKTARLWELATGRCLHTLEGHTGGVGSVALTPDGRLALTGGADKTARLWELATGRCLHTLESWFDSGAVAVAVALSSDGRLALTVGSGANAIVQLWDLPSERHLHSLGGGGKRDWSIALTPDGGLHLIGASDGRAWVSDHSGGHVRSVCRLKRHTGSVVSVALTPDGRLALTGRADGTVPLWELPSGWQRSPPWRGWSWGRCLRTLEGHTEGVLSIALTPDGRLALTGGGDGTARLWELASGRCLRTLEGRTASVGSVALSADGRLALTAESDGPPRLWELQTDQHRHSAFAYTRPRATGEAARAEAGLREVLVEVDRLIGTSSFAEAAAQLRSLRESPGYERDPAVLEQWRRAGRKGIRADLRAIWLRQELEGNTGAVHSVALTPDGRHALTGGSDNAARLWELASGDCLGTLDGRTRKQSRIRTWWGGVKWKASISEGHTYSEPMESVALTADGRLALTGGSGATVRLWELPSGDCLRTLKGHSGSVASVALVPDGRLALTGGSDGTVRLWELTSGDCLRSLDHAADVESIALTADGRFAITGGSDGTVGLWELPSGRCLRTLEGHTGGVGSVALTPDGRLAITGGSDGTVRLWELASGDCLRTLEGHTGGVGSVALAPDGRLAITGGSDGTVRLWELASGRCLRTLEGHSVTSVALTPDGQFLLTGAGDGSAQLWELDWDYEFPELADWDERARPLLEAFLRAQVPYVDPLIPDGPLRRGVPAWDQRDLDSLLHGLEDAGYGWLRQEGVLRELERMPAGTAEAP